MMNQKDLNFKFKLNNLSDFYSVKKYMICFTPKRFDMCFEEKTETNKNI